VEKVHRPYKEVKKGERIINKRSSVDDRQPKGYSPEYLVWYEAYPHKVGKFAGFKAYQRQTKNAADRELLDLNSPPWFEQFGSRESRYIPRPASFLNSRDWEEPPAPTTGPQVVRSGAADVMEAMNHV